MRGWVIAGGIIILLTMLLVAVPIATASINASTSLYPISPDKVYQGQPTQFKLTLYNLGSGALEVYQVKATFPWGTDYYFKRDDGNTLTIISGGSYDFTGTVTVSQSASSGTVSIQVHGKAMGDWLDSWPTYTNSITVYPVTLPAVTATGNPHSGTVPLAVYFQSTVANGIPPYTYNWTFGDGSIGNIADPSHMYAHAGTYTAQVTVTDSTYPNNQVASDSVTVNVSKATPVITWSNPGQITYGTALSEAQLNASANVAGSFAYTPAAGTVLSAGSHTLSVTFTPTDTTDYNTATKSVIINVVQPFPLAIPVVLIIVVCVTGGLALAWKVRSKPKHKIIILKPKRQ